MRRARLPAGLRRQPARSSGEAGTAGSAILEDAHAVGTHAATWVATPGFSRRVIILTRTNVAPHAGGKAPADVQDICTRMGFDNVSLPVVPERRFAWANVTRFVVGPLTLLARALLSGAADTVVIQHPIVGRLEKRLILFLFRRSRKIALIHDLDALRKPTNHTFDDLHFLGHCDVLIAHNEKMRQFLVRELPGPAVLVLGIFDYLVPGTAPRVPAPAPAPTRIFVVGNLHPMKASYLYRIGPLDTPIAAFGPNCTVERLPDNVEWMGIIGDKGLPVTAIDGFGLVWDGESPEGLEGHWGEYLKFNAPHKLSMYVVLGLPVIVHRNSAMADFVRAEGIGFDAESIAEAARRVKTLSGDEWQNYCNAVLRLRQKIVSGFHTERALDHALSMLGRPGWAGAA